MTDERHPPARPRRPLSVGRQDPPSGRWHPPDYDEEPTPPPVDPEDRQRWERQRARVSECERNVSAIVGRVGIQEQALQDLTRRVSGIETSSADSARSITSIDRQLALQGQSVAQIERGVARMESARDSDGAKARHIIQIAAAFAALAVSIISIITK